MPLPRKKKDEEETETYEPEPEPSMTLEQRRIIQWKQTQLIQAGFDTWHANRLANLAELNWRTAAALKQKGCKQELVYELLR